MTSTLSGVGGALMLTPNPVTAGIGATIVVGTLVYEHREAIGDALGDAAGAVADGAKKLFDGIF